MSNLNALWRVERKGDRRAARDPAPQFMSGVKGVACLNPYPYDAQGERFFRECGHCAKCWSAKKRDNTGRAMAEAQNSPDMVFFTLTVADVRHGSYAKSPLHAKAISRARSHMIKRARKLGNAPDAPDDTMVGEWGPVWPSVDPADYDERLRPFLFFEQKHPAAHDFRVLDRQHFLMRARNLVIADTKRMLGVPARMLRIEPGLTPKGKPKPVFQAAHEIAYWQHMMKTHTPGVRFISMGERGDQRGRCHWHVLLYFDKPLFRGSPATKDRPALAPSILLRSTPDATDWMGRTVPGDENHPLWELGYSQAKVCGPSADERLAFVRYIVSYMDQTTVTKRDRLMRKPRNAVYARSTKPALGHKYIIDRAEEAGRQGVRYDGWFQVPGVRFSTGWSVETGPDGQPRLIPADHFKNFLRGVLRQQTADAYAAAFERHHPNGSVPLTDFMLRFWDAASVDPMEADDQRPTAANKSHPKMWRARADMPETGPAPKRTAKPGYLVVKQGHQVLGTIRMDKSGFAIFVDGRDQPHAIPHGNLRDILPHAPHDLHLDAEMWIKDQRGPGWVSDREFRANRYKAQLDQRDALLRLAAFAPDPNPGYLGIDGPRGALSRKLAMHGGAHIPGSVVRDGWSDHQYQRVESKLRKPIKDRDP